MSQFLKRLSAAISQMKFVTIGYDETKPLDRFLWDVFAGWDWLKGYRKRDIIAIVRQSLANATRRVANCAGCSGDLLPPSPPTEKATARQDQAGKTCTSDETGDETHRTLRRTCRLVRSLPIHREQKKAPVVRPGLVPVEEKRPEGL
jgi:hypothetical protein